MGISLLNFLYLLSDTLNTAFFALLNLPLWLYALFLLIAVAFKIFCEYYDSRK
jgi:hypothetical protein